MHVDEQIRALRQSLQDERGALCDAVGDPVEQRVSFGGRDYARRAVQDRMAAAHESFISIHATVGSGHDGLQRQCEDLAREALLQVPPLHAERLAACTDA